ncbi:MAG TPA: IreB family regulatory phosphoprotein [Limnochordia bacterium]|nr:IreB family regulatory phosphoprotein [Limnochordia bacterium]
MFPPEAGLVGSEVRVVLRLAHEALSEKGYRPVDQIVGYLISGDPAYITSHKQARLLLTRLDRNDVLEEIVRSYLSALTEAEEH